MGLKLGWWVLAWVKIGEVGGRWWVSVGVEIEVGGWWVLWFDFNNDIEKLIVLIKK